MRVLITGGNKGIGLYITKRFLSVGDTVVIVARNFEGFTYAGHPSVQTIPFDLSNTEALPNLVQQTGEIDILINNAGICTGLTASEYTEKDIAYIVAVNIAAPIALITAYLPLFEKRGGGRVVNIASQAGMYGHFDLWYGATKAGLINATKSFANLYGRVGLVINSVSPGPVEVDSINESRRQERLELLRNRTILKRYAKPEEVADVVYWLAKESPEYLNGENYLINNGIQSLEL